LIISYNSQNLRDACATLERAEALIGYAYAQELMAVLSDAEAAETAAELIELYTPNAAANGGSIFLALGAQYRLSFVAVGSALVRDSGGGVNWREVRRLKLMDISPC